MNSYEWVYPTFIQPKQTKMIIFLSDFRKLKQKYVRTVTYTRNTGYSNKYIRLYLRVNSKIIPV